LPEWAGREAITDGAATMLQALCYLDKNLPPAARLELSRDGKRA
jgi:hypothetical protein